MLFKGRLQYWRLTPLALYHPALNPSGFRRVRNESYYSKPCAHCCWPESQSIYGAPVWSLHSQTISTYNKSAEWSSHRRSLLCLDICVTLLGCGIGIEPASLIPNPMTTFCNWLVPGNHVTALCVSLRVTFFSHLSLQNHFKTYCFSLAHLFFWFCLAPLG